MIFTVRLGIILIWVGVSILSLNFEAFAQSDYPNRPVEVVIPHAPGGTADLGTRFFADKWAEFLGQPVVVVNKPGAASAVGAKYVANAKPDGYTLLGSGDSPLVVVTLGRTDLGYNLDSFRILFLFAKNAEMFFSVKADSKWKTLNEILAEARNNPGKIKYSTYGVGGATHLVTEMLCKLTGVKLTLVPFQSGPESTTALIAGNVDLSVTMGLSGLVGSGLVRPLAVADEERALEFPGVPTLRELGYSVGFTSMYLLLSAPNQVPETVASKWVDAHNKARQKYEKEINERVRKLEMYPAYVEGKKGMQIYKQKEKLYKEIVLQTGIKTQ